METACPWWLLIYSGCLFLVVTCPWWPLGHGGCLFMGAVGLRWLLVYGGSLFMAVACQWQVLVHGDGLFIGRLAGPDRGTGTGLDWTDFSAVQSQSKRPDCETVRSFGTVQSSPTKDWTVQSSLFNSLQNRPRTGPDRTVASLFIGAAGS